MKLYNIVDGHWTEVCDHLPVIEELSEDLNFIGKDLAAAVASRCFYHLQEYDDSLRLALCSGKYFDISTSNEYIEKLLSICIDKYGEECRLKAEDPDNNDVDPKKEAIIEQMFQRCYRDECFEQAIGIALDTRRLDKVDEVCNTAIKAGFEKILDHTFSLCRMEGARVIPSRTFRLEVIDILSKYYDSLITPDHRNVCFGLQYLNRPNDVSIKLAKLLKSNNLNNALQAYQIAFDMMEAENQGFVLQVVSGYPALNSGGNNLSEEEIATLPQDVPVETYKERLSKLKRILTEGLDVDLTLNFLCRHSKSDESVLLKIKQATENRTTSLHNATIVAHAYMNAGTTQDVFLRDNLPWLGKATLWSKFSAVASIGVVNKGHVHESMNLLKPYLPSATGVDRGAGYQQAGALYALGLIHANKGGNGDSTTLSYLSNALDTGMNTQNMILQHGAALGIGLAGMATGNEGLFSKLKEILYNDDAIAGEGAAIGIGLLMLGHHSESTLMNGTITELLNYAHETKHEKIIRASSIALAMMVYGKEESGDVLIEQMTRDRDPIIRYGAMYATAMAYCGTADNSAVRRLLHVAVSDVSDDVRRAAVGCLGFVMFRQYEQVPKLVSLLAESFNAHVRFGACMAVGIACAGTAFKDALDLLMPVLDDQVDFVRQGACMAISMVLMQTSEARSPSVKKFNDHLMKVIEDKHQPAMAKTGAILAAGILEAGGRNVSISLSSRAGFLRGGSVAGMVLWLQHWYWYPMMHMISLSFTPTMMMGLNKDFDVPKDFNVHCKAPPSMFSYPKPPEKEDKKKLVTTAVLSTTARAKAREARKELKRTAGSASNSKASSPAKDGSPDKKLDDGLAPIKFERQLSNASYISTMSVDGGDDEGDGGELKLPKKEKEPNNFTVNNPERVIPAQLRFLQVKEESRYQPVAGALPTGILLLSDTTPDQPENVLKIEKIGLNDEAEMPEEFEWDPNDS